MEYFRFTQVQKKRANIGFGDLSKGKRGERIFSKTLD